MPSPSPTHSAASGPVASDADLDDLRRRLEGRRRPVDPWDGPDAQDSHSAQDGRGLGGRRLEGLLARWSAGFDWPARLDRLQALPWCEAGGLRAVHQRADHDAPTVVLLHGWPDSVSRYTRVLPLLSDVNVVVPALPGFPFSALVQAAPSVNTIADQVAAAMAELGYDRYVVSGGDIGGDVAEILADRHPGRVAAMHLTGVSARHVFSVNATELPEQARAYIGAAMAWNRDNGGYVAVQSTRPRTLMAALADSPAGLAAWLLEKVTAWSDDLAASFTDDDLLEWVSLYWFSNSIGTSFATYAEPAAIPRRTAVPTVVSAFAADIKPAPQAWAEQFVDLRAFVEHPRGGHFAAWEQPETFVEDLRLALQIGQESSRRPLTS